MDAIAEWSAAQQRVIDITSGLDADTAARTVPACPDWTVRELVSHMIGLGADIVAGNQPGDDGDAWTQAQVDERQDRDLTELHAEWDALADDLRAWMRDNDTRPLGDIVIHEQDLRGALGATGAHDTDGLHALRDRMVDGFAASVDGLGSITLRGPSWTWNSGDAEGDTVIEASDFDLTRALMTRRSAAQLRSWTTKGDVTPFLDAFAALGPLPESDLSE